MQAYEAGKAMYFATPPVQLVYAFHRALTTILTESPSLEERFAMHKAASKYTKDALEAAGFGFVPLDRSIAANGMSAVRYPPGVQASDIIPKLAEWVDPERIDIDSQERYRCCCRTAQGDRDRVFPRGAHGRDRRRQVERRRRAGRQGHYRYHLGQDEWRERALDVSADSLFVTGSKMHIPRV